MTPGWGYNQEETSIRVAGAGLYPAVFVDPSADVRFDAQYSVWLGQGRSEQLLDGVTLEAEGYDTLRATVPTGLTPGLYDLTVRAPWGETTTLENAFTVTSTRADHLELDLEARVVSVGDGVRVGLRVLDPSGGPVNIDADVVLTVTSESGTSDSGVAGVSFSAVQGLDDALELVGEVGLQGSLGADGEAWVELSSTLPGDLQLTLSMSDAESTVLDDTDFVSFVPGALDRVHIQLPSDGFVSTAGTPFGLVLTLEDSDGNVLTDRDARVYLRETCGGQVNESGYVDLIGGVGQIDVAVRTATYNGESDDCPVNGVEAYGEVSGSSAGFQVVPAELTSLELLVAGDSQPVVTAGVAELTVIIQAVDPFGNRHVDFDSALTFTDNVGGLSTDGDPVRGAASCLPWVEGLRGCSLTLVKAADFVTVEVESEEGLIGRSVPVTVLANEPVRLVVVARQSEVTAGAVLEIASQLIDAYGNAAALNGASFEVDDGQGEVICTTPGLEQSGAYVLSCIPTRASEGAFFEVSTAQFGLFDATNAVVVNNADLYRVTLAAPAEVVAGEAFTLSAEGFDAYNNPYIVGDPAVDLRASPGSVNISALTLGADGAASVEATLTVASEAARVTASQGGVDLGEVEVEVTAAGLDRYAVDLMAPWVWLGEPAEVSVVAQDAYGNAVLDHTTPVTLTSDAALFVARTLSDFEDGVLTASVDFDSAGLQDRVEVADSGGVVGVSTRIDVLDGACASPPTAVLRLDGRDEVSACLNSGLASVSADTSASAAGGAAIARYIVADGDGGFTRTSATSVSLTFSDAGLYAPELVVVDERACGASDVGVLWVNDKGAPAGLVEVAMAHSSRTASGAAADADTTVSVTAVDCAGDPASGAALYARADLGELSAGLSAGARGLSLTLDSLGQGSFTWSGQSVRFDGEARVSVGVLSGAAYGEESVSVEGDSWRPEVAWVDPSGATSELLSEVVIGFTEPLATGEYDDKVALTGPNGPVIVSASLSSDGRELSLTPEAQIDAAVGAWTVELTSAVRDDSGNRISGDWSGGAAAFSAQFGAVSDDGLSVNSCAADTSSLSPDGVDGAGEEADEVGISVVANITPTWWLLEVYDAHGQRARSVHAAANGRSDSLTWDARGDDGHVLGAGLYTLELSAVDAQDNITSACALEVQLIERYSSP